MIEYVPWQSMDAIEADPRAEARHRRWRRSCTCCSTAPRPPFNDPRVRRAVAHAVKRDDIVQAAFFGRGKALERLPIVEGTPFYDAELARWLELRPRPRPRRCSPRPGIANGFSTLAALHRAVRHAQGHRRGRAAAPRRHRHPCRAAPAGLVDARRHRQSAASTTSAVHGHRRRQQRPGRASRASSTARSRRSYVPQLRPEASPHHASCSPPGRAEFDQAKRARRSTRRCSASRSRRCRWSASPGAARATPCDRQRDGLHQPAGRADLLFGPDLRDHRRRPDAMLAFAARRLSSRWPGLGGGDARLPGDPHGARAIRRSCCSRRRHRARSGRGGGTARAARPEPAAPGRSTATFLGGLLRGDLGTVAGRTTIRSPRRSRCACRARWS